MSIRSVHPAISRIISTAAHHARQSFKLLGERAAGLAVLCIPLCAAALCLHFAIELRDAKLDLLERPEALFTSNEAVPPLAVVSDNGNNAVLTLSGTGQKTLLYVTAPKCAWCQVNLASIRGVMKAVRPTMRTVVLSIGDMPDVDTIANYGDTAEVYAISQSEWVLRAYGIPGTPTTVLLDEAGRPVARWIGAYISDDTRYQIAGALSLTVPVPSVSATD